MAIPMDWSKAITVFVYVGSVTGFLSLFYFIVHREKREVSRISDQGVLNGHLFRFQRGVETTTIFFHDDRSVVLRGHVYVNYPKGTMIKVTENEDGSYTIAEPGEGAS